MAWRFSPYAVPLFAGAVLLVTIAALAWRQCNAKGARLLMALSLTTAVYVGGYGFELSGTTLGWVKFWLPFEYVGVALIPLMLLGLYLLYTGREYLVTPINAIILLTIPIMTILFAWTNDYHHLIWRDMHLDAYGRQWLVAFSTGPWYWVNAMMIGAVIFGGIIIMVFTYRAAQGIYRAQSGLMVLALIFPAVTYLVYLSHVIPTPIDLTAYSLIPTSMVMAWMVLNAQFLDLMPVARRVVLVSLPDAVLVVDTRARIVYLNPAAQALIGPDAASRLGEPLATVFEGQLAAILTSGVSAPPCEIESTRQGKSRFWDVQLSPLAGQYGTLEGTMIVLRDISERKEADEEREHLITSLDAFAHTVAHDLKNLVTVLLTYSVSLQEDLPSMSQDDVMSHLDVMVESGHKLNSVIDGLLFFARVNKLESIPIAPLDTAAIVAQARQRLAVLSAQSGAQIRVPDVWPVAQGYAPWIEEVWVNYLSNAIKYGGTPPEIVLGAVRRLDGTVCFSVRDNGAGLTADQQAQLFLPFRQLHQLRTDGHGLGLSIVLSIVQKLGGEVSIESEPGQGSTFFFTLPGPLDP